MKKFLVKAFIIATLLLIPFYIADYLKTKDYRSRNYYPFKTWNDIVAGRLDSDTWIIGSSRAWVMYNPQILDSLLNISSYNLGCNGEFIKPDLQCCEIAKAFNTPPKYIIIDVFCNSMTTALTPRCKFNYTPYVYKRKVRKIIKNNENISSEYLFIPYYRYRECDGGRVYYEDNKTIPLKGYCPQDALWDGSNMRELDTLHYACEPEAISLLNDFIKECKKDTINVILVHSPFYREGFEKIHNHKQMMTMFQDIAKHNGIPFLDYTDDPISYDTLNFYNAMHLNTRGADLFSAKLAHDLDSLGLIPARKDI